jgi:predicted ribonuclease YlaK
MKDGEYVVNKLPFYDTNAILDLQDKILESEFVLSTVTLYELEHIKVSKNKDDETKYRARKAIHILDDNFVKYTSITPTSKTIKILDKFKLDQSPDNLIIACAYEYNQNFQITFISNDICCKVIARNIFGLDTSGTVSKIEKPYTGFKEVVMADSDMAIFYENLNENTYELLINEYLIIKDKDGKVIDKFRWNGEEYLNVKFITIKSNYFGTVKPYDGDVYQQCALNSISYNQITMLKGAAGTGKSYLAIGHLFYLLEKHKIEKIIIFCNTVATANSAKLGFYPGSKDEKLLDSSIGNMLSAKLGGKLAVQELIDDNKLVLLPMSDVRGFDTTGMKAGIYITEAQNMDISLMKLALQRIGEDCICILDGDYQTQVDMSQYAGANNGMRRVSEVFRNNDFYGEIELQNIYRSKIAKIAELM